MVWTVRNRLVQVLLVLRVGFLASRGRLLLMHKTIVILNQWFNCLKLLSHVWALALLDCGKLVSFSSY